MKNDSLLFIMLLVTTVCILNETFGADSSVEKAFVEINSVAELAEYAGKDNITVTMKPGVYEIYDTSTSQNITLKTYKDGEPKSDFPISCLLNFSGQNSTYKLDGVIIHLDTKLHRAFGRNKIYEVFVTGNNNTIEGLSVRDVGEDFPVFGAIMMHVMGDNNTISNADLYIHGSSPYGYGNLLGKGGSPLVPLHKHSSLLVTGRNTKLLGCKVVTHAFGHGIVMQGAVNTLVKDCYVEGQVRSTDEMLKETSGLAHGVGFKSDYPPGRFIPGQMKCLAEDGVRTYPSGSLVGRRTEKVTVVNCTVKNMRSGFALSAGLGPTKVSGCTATECTEKGFSVSTDGVIENSKGDAMYGPLLTFVGKSIKNCTVDLELINTVSDYPPKRLAEINGKGHKIKITNYQNQKRSQDVPIVFGESFWADVHKFRKPETDPRGFSGADGVMLINHTGMPIVFGKFTKNCKVMTNGKVMKDQGQTNIVNPVGSHD